MKTPTPEAMDIASWHLSRSVTPSVVRNLALAIDAHVAELTKTLREQLALALAAKTIYREHSVYAGEAAAERCQAADAALRAAGIDPDKEITP